MIQDQKVFTGPIIDAKLIETSRKKLKNLSKKYK